MVRCTQGATRPEDPGTAGPSTANVASAVPDAVAPPPRHPRFPLFDGLRAIAVLSVVAVHAHIAADGPIGSGLADRLLAHLNLGVTIFFVISGFLLYRPFIAARCGGADAPRLPDYAKRRFLRIYPAYWLILTVLTIAPGLTGVYGGDWWQQYGILDFLPLHNGIGCSGAFQDCGLAQTWSLVVELTFYAVLPIYVLLSARLLRSLGRRSWIAAELILLGGLSALSIILRFSSIVPFSSPWIDTSVLGSIYWFALGMGLAVASVGFGDARGGGIPIGLIRSHPLLPWLAAAALYLVVALSLPATPFLFDRGDQLLNYVLFGLISVLLVLPAAVDDAGGLPRRFLTNPIVAWIGLVSYGIFLWHYVVTLQLDGGNSAFLLVFLVTLGVSIPCAAASYYLLERPVLRLKYRRFREVFGTGVGTKPRQFPAR